MCSQRSGETSAITAAISERPPPARHTPTASGPAPRSAPAPDASSTVAGGCVSISRSIRTHSWSGLRVSLASSARAWCHTGASRREAPCPRPRPGASARAAAAREAHRGPSGPERTPGDARRAPRRRPRPPRGRDKGTDQIRVESRGGAWPVGHRWRFRRFRPGPQSDVHGYVSSPPRSPVGRVRRRRSRPSTSSFRGVRTRLKAHRRPHAGGGSWRI